MSHATAPRHLLVVAALALLWASPAAAHGLLVSIRGEGRFVTGRVYYSDGTLGTGQYAELKDLSAPGAKPRSGKTDAHGGFRFEGVPGHRYRFLTEGEEGHQTEMLITLAAGARGKFIDGDAAKTAVASSGLARGRRRAGSPQHTGGPVSQTGGASTGRSPRACCAAKATAGVADVSR